MLDGFPLLTTKKMPFRVIATELMWFLRGDTNIKFLVDNDCHIWDGDAYKAYRQHWMKEEKNWVENFNKPLSPELIELRDISKEEFINKIKTDDEFAKQWGELGPIYGKQWRNWNGNGSPLTKDYEGNVSSYLVKPIDQIANLINDLKTNPDSRRLMVNAWNVGELDQMTLPPCHYGFQVYTRELSEDERYNLLSDDEKKSFIIATNPDVKYGEEVKYTLDTFYKHIPTRAISLMYNARSQDFPLGTPFNISSYALLLEIIGKMVNMVPDELIANMGDCHIYLNQIDGVKEQLTREPYPLPALKINSGNENWNLLEIDEIINTFDTDITFKLENYQSHPAIKMPLSN
jgi:thymidylate synthase